MILRSPTEDENGGVSLHPALIFKGIRHSRMLLSGIQETGTGPPIKTFGGDVFGSRDQFTPNPKFSKEITKDTKGSDICKSKLRALRSPGKVTHVAVAPPI